MIPDYDWRNLAAMDLLTDTPSQVIEMSVVDCS